MKWIKKVKAFFALSALAETDEFSKGIYEALGGLKKSTEEFATGVQDYAMEREMAELRERIAKLEAIILPMRNGTPVRH